MDAERGRILGPHCKGRELLATELGDTSFREQSNLCPHHLDAAPHIVVY